MAVDSIGMPFYSSSYPRASYTQGNQFDLGNPSLTQSQQSAEGQRFFFASIKTDTASPTEMYLAPVWQKAFGEAPTPLLVLAAEGDNE